MEKVYKVGKARLSSWVKEYVKKNGNSASHLLQQYYGTSVDRLIEYNDTSEATSFYQMFANCVNLKSIPLFDTRKGRDFNGVFYGCSSCLDFPTLKIVQENSGAPNLFAYCRATKVIPPIDMAKCTNLDSAFKECKNIEEINLKNINANLDIHECSLMQQPALHKVIDNLVQQTTTRTLALGSTLLSRVSDEYKQKAKAKGWTLA